MKSLVIIIACLLSVQLAYSQSMIVNKNDGSKATFLLSDIESITFEDLNGFIDSRDGKFYRTIQIGEQVWLAENLAYLSQVSPSGEGSATEKYYYVYDYEGTNLSEAKQTAHYTTYGVLYNWEAAKTACPSGWHLPTDDDWKVLERYLGMSESDANASEWRESGNVGKKLKSTSGWYSNGNGDNSNGFNAIPGGGGNDEGFNGLGNYAYFWSSSENGTSYAWTRALEYNDDGVDRYYNSRRFGYSVRCQKN